MKILTDRVLTHTTQPALTERPADVVLDESEVFADLRDTERIVHATEGLEPGDVAVFLEFLDDQDQELPTKIGGFIVGALNSPHDGGGVLVSIDALNGSYSEQISTHELMAKLALVEALDDTETLVAANLAK